MQLKTDEELKDFVKSKLKRGYPEGELRNELLQQGYSSEQIQQAIYRKSTPATERKQLDNNPLWYLVSVGFIITGISIKSVSYYTESDAATTLIVVGAIGLVAKIVIAIKAKQDQDSETD